MLLNLIIAVCIGGCMGLLGHAKRQGKIEKPRITKRFIYLGFLEEVLIGTIAAVLIVVTSETESLFRVVFLSILAGYGGDTIIQSLDLVRRVQVSKNSLQQKPTNEQETIEKNDETGM
ncbi:DUF4257 domain-containing protein [Ferdinandcohnia quinoae]|uniref:DUF4257 domain-containing protein n=1 Tax=Fredinandcohnia quinoae TaxID=2918902 RepID=A0AAW5E235_9BACI|nr:DUF4257 domain-containing protein [Fredinandcohnia sp. SECRCQ15]MCH1626972.1 DUF4257 domain-containing protein [Fredinandcohnia sp. SECRCQ15]